MPLFGFGKASHDEAARIERFWAWWASARPMAESALDAKDLPHSLIDDVSRKVRDIHPSLVWEVGPGLTTRYQLTVTGEGDIERRALTERWYEAAPKEPGWEYFAARQALPNSANSVLTIGPHRIQLADLRFGATVDDKRERINLSVWHPLFQDLDDAAQQQLTYLVLDNVLGEDGVERWCGTVEVSVTPPGDSGVDTDAVRELVDRLAKSATQDQYILARATAADGTASIVAMNTALKQIDHLDKASRLRLVVHLRQPSPSGMPTGDESHQLESFEDRLTAAIGDAVFAGRVTGGGKRTLNWYVADSTLVRSAAKGVVQQTAWRVDVKVDADPRWEGLRKSLLD